MSTKKIRATLRDFIDRLEDTLAEPGLSRHQRETTGHRLNLAKDAEAEVDAIEAAAKALAVADKYPDSETYMERRLMKSIAKDAP